MMCDINVWHQSSRAGRLCITDSSAWNQTLARIMALPKPKSVVSLNLKDARAHEMSMRGGGPKHVENHVSTRFNHFADTRPFVPEQFPIRGGGRGYTSIRFVTCSWPSLCAICDLHMCAAAPVKFPCPMSHEPISNILPSRICT